MNISKSGFVLYSGCENYIEIRTMWTKTNKITTHWINHKPDIDAKRKLMHNLKINGCAICGYDKCDAALDFHHINSESKKFNLNQSHMGKPWESILIEFEKCILLCKNCHYKIHTRGD